MTDQPNLAPELEDELDASGLIAGWFLVPFLRLWGWRFKG